MNRFFTGVFFLFVLGFAAGCKKDDDDSDYLTGDWTRMADYVGVARNGAVAFLINDTAFVGTGVTNTGTSTVARRVGDFMKYNPGTDDWYNIASLPEGTERTYATAFSINGKGYVGLGTSDGNTALRDFWEYNPKNNSWRQVASLPAAASARYGAVGFSINGKGYIGCGSDGSNDLNDFWEYTPGTGSSLGTWSQVASIKSKRQFPFVFVIGNKAYVGGGYNNSAAEKSFYSFDPSANTWTRLHSLNPDNDSEETDDIKNNDDYNYNLSRKTAVAFTINGYGYLTTGNNGSPLNTTWQYNPGKDIWEQVDTFEGTSREMAVGFAIGSCGYVTTGTTGSTRLYDTWRFDPNGSDDD